MRDEGQNPPKYIELLQSYMKKMAKWTDYAAHKKRISNKHMINHTYN